MLNKVGSLVLVFGVASCVLACGSGGSGGSCGATTTPITTLAQACAHNCCLGSGLATCSTTQEVCVQSCLKTYDNTYAVNADLGRMYTEMMLCIATDPFFATVDGFTCAKPDRALNKWSPVVDPSTDSPCKQKSCDWNCTDGTTGNMDPWVDLQCACSSVH
jgi:hypothetical protein